MIVVVAQRSEYGILNVPGTHRWHELWLKILEIDLYGHIHHRSDFDTSITRRDRKAADEFDVAIHRSFIAVTIRGINNKNRIKTFKLNQLVSGGSLIPIHWMYAETGYEEDNKEIEDRLFIAATDTGTFVNGQERNGSWQLFARKIARNGRNLYFTNSSLKYNGKL